MARYATLAVYSQYVGKAIVYAETSTGYWGFSNDTSTGQRCDCSSSTLRAVLVPTQNGYYCNGWSSSGYIVDSTTNSLISFTSDKSTVVNGQVTGGYSVLGAAVTIIDEHGTHSGTPTGSDMHFYTNHVIGVKHLTTDSGYVFKGWRITKASSISQAGTLLSNGGTTSDNIITFPSNYNYAVVFKTSNLAAYPVTIEALYARQCTLTYNANGGSPTPSSQSGESGTTITLASAITRSNYNFGGWSIEGVTYAANANYTLQSNVTATAIWTQVVTYTVSFDKNNSSATGSAIPSVVVTKGNSTILPYPDGWSLSKHIFGYWCETSDGTGVNHEAGESFRPTKTIKLYAIWVETQGDGAANDWYDTDYVNSTRHSHYQYYYHLLVSTSLSSSISFLIPTTIQGSGTSRTKDGQTTTYTRSSVTNMQVTVPADNASSQTANATDVYYSNGGKGDRQCLIWDDYYIPSSGGTCTHLNNVPYSDWTWTAPSVTNYDFVGWYTINKSHYISEGDTYSVPNPKADFTLCISKDRTITWGTLSQALNFYCYYAYSTKLAEYKYRSECKYYNFIRLVYKLQTKKITFYPNGGTGTMASQDIPVTGGNLHANTFTRTNYVFLGWATSAQGSVVYADGQLIYPTTNLSLYAKWSSLERVVTFNPNGGISSLYFKRVYQGQTYGTLPTCTYSGCTFLGWFTQLEGGSQVTSSTVVTSTVEHTLYAHWQRTFALTYNVTFVDNTGTNSTTTRTFTCGTSTQLPWINSGLGWSIPQGRTLDQATTWITSFNGGTTYANHATVIDLVGEGDTQFLYANWGRSNLTITFNPNGGSVQETTRSVPYGQQVGTLPIPSYSGKNFIGWFTDASSGSQITSQTVPSQSCTYHAHWSNGKSDWIQVKYKIIFQVNGGTISSSYGEFKYIKGVLKTLPTSSQVTKSGFTFDGWYAKADFSGSVQTTIPATASGSKTYYAKWV